MLQFKSVRVLLAALLCFWTIRCGNAGKSSDIHLSVAPGQPVVINTPYTLNTNTVINAPWFAFVLTVTNDSDTTMTILNLTLHVTARLPNGTQIAGDVTMDPSSGNFTEACSATVTQAITYTDMGEYAPGESSTIKLDYRGIIGGGCTQPATLHPTLYAGSLPVVTNNGNGVYNYTIEVTPNGWFGTINAPTDRLNVHYYFSTN
jgi:hypothetical protein